MPYLPAHSRAYVTLLIKDSLSEFSFKNNNESEHSKTFKVILKFSKSSIECISNLDFKVPLGIRTSLVQKNLMFYVHVKITNYTNNTLLILNTELRGCKTIENPNISPFELSSQQIILLAYLVSEICGISVVVKFSNYLKSYSKVKIDPVIDRQIRAQVFELEFKDQTTETVVLENSCTYTNKDFIP